MTRTGLRLRVLAFAFECSLAFGILRIDGAAGRLRLVAPRRSLAKSPCPASCPPPSSCIPTRAGTPMCVCPSGQRFISGVCSNATLAHSDFLDGQNMARAAVGVQSLSWSDDVAGPAQLWANTLASSAYKCALVHGGHGNDGQNIAWYSGAPSASFDNSSAAFLWVNEGASWSYSTFPGGCAPTKSCGHYTQVIWSSTSLVGCGVARCGPGLGTIWVCDYRTAGNVGGQYPYRQDPCYTTTCPDISVCNSTTGAAVCQCPPGLALVNSTCITDPCINVTCSGNLVCSGTSGAAQCVCPAGLALASPAFCTFPRCVGTSCPSTSTCTVTPKGAPFCVCPAGTGLLNGVCTSATSKPFPMTNIVVYSGGYFANSADMGVGPVLIQSPALGKCVNLPAAFQAKVGSYMIIWNAAIATLPPGATAFTCNKVFFWPQINCYGKATGWANPNGASVAVAGAAGPARAISCA